EAAQRSVDGVQQVLPRVASIPGRGAHFTPALGCENRMPTLILQPAADNDFGAAALRTGGIYVRGIDDVHPGFSRLVEDSMAFGFVRLLCAGSGAKDPTGDR